MTNTWKFKAVNSCGFEFTFNAPLEGGEVQFIGGLNAAYDAYESHLLDTSSSHDELNDTVISLGWWAVTRNMSDMSTLSAEQVDAVNKSGVIRGELPGALMLLADTGEGKWIQTQMTNNSKSDRYVRRSLSPKVASSVLGAISKGIRSGGGAVKGRKLVIHPYH